MTKEGKSMVTLKFGHRKDTAGTYVYQEIGPNGEGLTAATGAWVGTLYLRRDKWKDKPAEIEVTITVPQ